MGLNFWPSTVLHANIYTFAILSHTFIIREMEPWLRSKTWKREERESMLLSLARKVSDHLRPEAFYKDTTFEKVEADESITMLQDESGMMLPLAQRLKDTETARSGVP